MSKKTVLGPSMDEYISSFEERMTALSRVRPYDLAWPEYGNLPLDLLEQLLADQENMGRAGYSGPGRKSLPILFESLKEYCRKTKEDLFGYYYGFLCFRLFIHAFCVGLMVEANTLDHFLKHLDPHQGRAGISKKLVTTSINDVILGMQAPHLGGVPKLLGTRESTMVAFPSLGGIDYDQIEFIKVLLWHNRRYFMALTKENFLPGGSGFLFVICSLTLSAPIPEPRKTWNVIEDLIARHYLVSSNEERRIVRQLFTQIASDHFVDHTNHPDDARAVAEHYIRLLTPPLDPEIIQILHPDVAQVLLLFVLYVAPKKYLPAVIGRALSRLGLEFDAEGKGQFLVERYPIPRGIAANIFTLIGGACGQMKTKEMRREYAHILADGELLGLAGRTLLTITKADFKKTPAHWEMLIESLPAIADALIQSVESAPDVLNDHQRNWAKVAGQIKALATMYPPGFKSVSYFTQAWNAWTSLAVALELEKLDGSPVCMNPRCVISFVKDCELGITRLLCDQCHIVSYCSLTCQNAHWLLETSESHRFHCVGQAEMEVHE
ncbi:hypothetical protein BDV93DRAFT_608782 [Ceratobasidium sp. AG-I]|nr:hypothetical protein BDV93DRAFT_608782 [Ceratobasidium sp. AG-I]